MQEQEDLGDDDIALGPHFEASVSVENSSERVVGSKIVQFFKVPKKEVLKIKGCQTMKIYVTRFGVGLWI